MVDASSIWRIIAREYVVVNIAVVVLFSLSLAYFAKNLELKKISRIILFISIGLLVAAQYQTFNPLKSTDTNKFQYSNAPDTYYWLKGQDNIKSIAEYPIEKAAEANSHGYYLTMQYIHGKPLLNSARSDSPQEPGRSSIKNLSDPQTLSTLHALGIDTIVVHGVNPEELDQIPYLSVLYVGDEVPDKYLADSPAITNDYIAVVGIDGDVPDRSTSIEFVTDVPRNSVIQTSANNWAYEIPSKTVISNRTLKDKTSKTADTICFDARMSATKDEGTLVLKIKGSIVFMMPLVDEYRQVKVTVPTDVDIEVSSANGHNMQATKLGCTP